MQLLPIPVSSFAADENADLWEQRHIDAGRKDDEASEWPRPVDPDEQLIDEFDASLFRREDESAARDRVLAMLSPSDTASPDKVERQALPEQKPAAGGKPAAPKFEKSKNECSGFDNCWSGTVRLAFAPAGELVSMGAVAAVPAMVSDVVTSIFELRNARGEREKLRSEKEGSQEGNASFSQNYAEIVSIRTKIAAGEIDRSGGQARLQELKAANRKHAKHAVSHDKAAANEPAAKLTLWEKSFRFARDLFVGPSNSGVSMGKFADAMQVAAAAKSSGGVAGKLVPTTLGASTTIAGGVIAAASGALHLSQSIPEMMRCKRRVDELSGLQTRLGRIGRENIGDIIGARRAEGQAAPDVVDEVKEVLAHVVERCKADTRTSLRVAKFDYARGIVRCCFGIGSIILGIVGIFFAPVALAALLLGAAFAIYIGVHILIMRQHNKQQEQLKAQEEKELEESRAQSSPTGAEDGSVQAPVQPRPRDLPGNSAWLLMKVSDYLCGRADGPDGKFRSGAVKRLMLAMGMDKVVMKALQAKAEAIAGIADGGERASAVRGLRQELRYYLFEGGAARKAPSSANTGSV
jgi:hypothetical protein